MTDDIPEDDAALEAERAQLVEEHTRIGDRLRAVCFALAQRRHGRALALAARIQSAERARSNPAPRALPPGDA